MIKWNIDTAHTSIGFKIKHLVVSTVRGHFTEFSGYVEANDDTFENAKVTFTAEAKSVSTSNEARDNHLRSADFFDVEKFPQITFNSESFVKKGDSFEIIGNLTMKDVTKEITLEASFAGIGTDMEGGRIASFDITGSISRKDFNLTWNNLIETGQAVVGDTVWFDIHVELKEEK